MKLDPANIYSLSDFQRNTREHITRLKDSGTPAVLTVNGQAELVIQSAEANQKLVEDHELIESMRTIGRSLEQVKRGEGTEIRKPLKALADEHGITIR